MSEEYSIDFGLVPSVLAHTYGEPGNRTFNITASSKKGKAVVWMEKERLIEIGGAIEENLKRRPGTADIIPEETAEAELPVNAEFKAVSITLGYNMITREFSISARTSVWDDGDEEEDEEREVKFNFSEVVAERIAQQIRTIASAGRPICPYCENPVAIHEEHSCHKRNGHAGVH